MPGFDLIAPVYDRLAGFIFGRRLRQASVWVVAAGLPPTARRILFIGGGTGRLLPDVLRAAPMARVLYVEASAEMLRLTRQVLARLPPAEAARVTLRQGTEAGLTAADGPFDAVLAFFFLDLFSPAELAVVLQRLGAGCAPGCRWLVADFAPPRHGWQRALLTVMYAFFGLVSGVRARRLPDWPTALATSGLHETSGAVFGPNSLLRAGVWQAP